MSKVHLSKTDKKVMENLRTLEGRGNENVLFNGN